LEPSRPPGLEKDRLESFDHWEPCLAVDGVQLWTGLFHVPACHQSLHSHPLSRPNETALFERLRTRATWISASSGGRQQVRRTMVYAGAAQSRCSSCRRCQCSSCRLSVRSVDRSYISALVDNYKKPWHLEIERLISAIHAVFTDLHRLQEISIVCKVCKTRWTPIIWWLGSAFCPAKQAPERHLNCP
jgi:hypothetical protein